MVSFQFICRTVVAQRIGSANLLQYLQCFLSLSLYSTEKTYNTLSRSAQSDSKFDIFPICDRRFTNELSSEKN